MITIHPKGRNGKEMNDKQSKTKTEKNAPDPDQKQGNANLAHSPNADHKKRTPKQIAALLCVILLICLYLFTFIVACLDFPGADRLFPICLVATIGLPILLWIYIWLYGMMKEKHTMASADILHSDSLTGTRLVPESPEEPAASTTSDNMVTLRKSAPSVSKNKKSESDSDIH